MPGYYPQFTVALIDSDGYIRPIPEVQVEVWNVTTASDVGPLTANDEGIIEEGTVTGSAGDVIELAHSTYPRTARMILQATQAEAYTAFENDLTTFIVDNLFTDELEATAADIYIKDNAEPDDVPKFLGSVKPGTTGQLPYQTQITKTMRIYSVSKGEDFLKTENALNEQAEYVDVVVTAINGTIRSLFDHIAGYSTLSTLVEDAYTDQLTAGTLAVDGDKLAIFACGFTAANANEKIIIYDFGGSTLIQVNTNASAAYWTLTGNIIRVDAGALYYGFTVNIGSETPYVSVEQVLGLDLDATNYDLKLQLQSPDNAGDVSARMGHTIFYPAAPVAVVEETDYWTLLGDRWVLNGDPWAFNP